MAIQISSIYNPQTRIAKEMIAEGKLGKVYHARSVGHRRQGRPGYDMPFFSQDFIDPNIGVHGPLFDLGIYHLAQMLYVLGMPELESVYGFQSCDYWTDPAIDKLVGRTAPVEDLGVGMARFKGGLCMDIYEDWAIHMEDIGGSFIAGSLGGLKFNLGWRPKKAKPVVAPATYQPRNEPKKQEPKKEYREEPAKQQPAEQPIYQGADVDIFFDLNKSVIRDDQVNTLNRLVSFMRNTPDAKVKLDGYADKQTGNAEINQELSEQRVIAVRQYLVSRGIDQSRISTAAHGDKVQPFSGAQNRAVTCRIR